MYAGVEMVGDNTAAIRLGEHAARGAAVLEVAAHAIREDFQALSARRFGAHGPGWAPLTDTTVRIKTRRGMPQPSTPMYGTGALMFSLAGDTEHTVFEIGPDEVLMGTNVPYAQFHQYGPRTIRVFGRGSATLPQRKVVDITSVDALRWAGIIAAALWGAP